MRLSVAFPRSNEDERRGQEGGCWLVLQAAPGTTIACKTLTVAPPLGSKREKVAECAGSSPAILLQGSAVSGSVRAECFTIRRKMTVRQAVDN